MVLDRGAWPLFLSDDINERCHPNKEDDNDKGAKDNRKGIAHFDTWKRMEQ